MSRISNSYGWAGVACFAIALAAVGSAFAQEESQQNQGDQSQQQSSDQQSDQQSNQQDEQDQQNASQSEQQKQAQQREQQERQRQQQDRQRDQQSRDRGQSTRDDSRTSRDRDEWPQPNRRAFGRESRDFRSEQQWSDDSRRDSQFNRDRAPRSGRRSESAGRDQQGGLGVSIVSDGREGVVVSRVHSGSPAEEMGIRERDRITQVNGREVRSVQEFISQIRNMDPGQQVELDIRRAAGGEQTVRGELESRDEALADRGQQQERYLYQERDQYEPQQGRDSSQTSYEEERGGYSPSRSGQISTSRLEQIERQVDRMTRELDELRFALQDIRRQSGQPGQAMQWDRERTASYDEYQRTTESPRRTTERWQGDSNRFRQADRSRGILRRSGDVDGSQRIESSRQVEGQSSQRTIQSDRDTEFSRDAERSAPSGQRSESQYRGNLDSDQSRDADESPGGEIGEARQHVGPEDLNE